MHKSDVYSISSEGSLYRWTRRPYGNPDASLFYSHESFPTVKDAYNAAAAIAEFNGILSFPFDDGRGDEHSEFRSQWLVQQVRIAQTVKELEAFHLAIWNYCPILFRCVEPLYLARLRKLHEELNVYSLDFSTARKAGVEVEVKVAVEV